MITKIHQEKHRKNKSPKRTCLRHRGSCKPKNYTCNVQPFNLYPSPSSVGEHVNIYIYLFFFEYTNQSYEISPTKTLQKKKEKPPLILKSTPRKTNMSPKINGWKMYFLLRYFLLRGHSCVFGGVNFFSKNSGSTKTKVLEPGSGKIVGTATEAFFSRKKLLETDS